MTKTKTKTTSKTKTAAKIPMKKPLTVKIHGDGIAIDVCLSDGDGFKSLRDAVDSIMKRYVPAAAPQTVAPPSSDDLRDYAEMMLHVIGATSAPEDLRKLEEMLDLGKLTVKERLGQVSGAAAPSGAPSDTATPNGAAASA